MGIVEQVQKDLTDAMRARDEQRLSALRMVKAALKNREIDKRAPLDDKDAMQVLNTLVKQRKDSIEQFTRGNRPELADKESKELALIESYLPKSATDDEIAEAVRAKIAELGSPSMKEMGNLMKLVMSHFQALGARVDGKVVSDLVKKELSKSAP